MSKDSSDYDVADSDMEEGPSAAVIHQSALPSAAHSMIPPNQLEQSRVEHRRILDESLKDQRSEGDKKEDDFDSENSSVSGGKDDVLSKALEILKESDPETKSATSKRKPAGNKVLKSRNPINVEEDPLRMKKLHKFAKIPILNKETANPNTYDIEYLLDPKIQNRTKAKLSKSSSVISNSNLRIHEIDHIKKNKQNVGTARKRIEMNEPTSNLDLIISPRGHNVDVEERFYKYKEKVNQKVKLLRTEYEKKEQEVCTFKPLVNPNQSKRTVEEFISSMEEYNKAKVEKIKNLKEMYEKEKGDNNASHKPSICKKSEAILDKNKSERSGPVHENLYKGYKKAFNKQLDEVTKEDAPSLNTSISDSESNLNFIPKVNNRSKNIKRTESIDKILYKDALRRRNKSVDITNSKIKFISTRSEKVLAKKFKDDFDETWKGLDVERVHKLNYTKLSELLKQLSFLKKESTQERILLLKMWKILGGEEKNQVAKDELYTFLKAILSFPTASRPLDESMSSVSSHYGNFQDGVFYVNDAQGRKIHRTFEVWYENRLSVTNKSYLNRSFKHTEDYSFHPQLSSSSSKLASDYRNKRSDSVGPHNQFIEYLINEKKKTLEKNEKLKREKEDQEVESCTFRPKTTSIPASSQVSSVTRSTKKETLAEVYLKTVSDPTAKVTRTEVLYNFSKIANDNKSKRMRNPEDLEIEKNKEECSFAPDLKASSKSIVNLTSSGIGAKGVTELIQRLRKARADNELVKVMTETRSSLIAEAKPIVTSLETSHKAQSTFDASKLKKSSKKSGIFTKSESAPYLNAFMKNMQKKKDELLNLSPKFNSNKRPSLLNISSRSGAGQTQEVQPTVPSKSKKLQRYDIMNSGSDEPNISYSDSDSIVISVNLSPDMTDQIKVKPGDNVKKLVEVFVNKHGKIYIGLNESMKDKLITELNAALEAVEEESDSEI